MTENFENYKGIKINQMTLQDRWVITTNRKSDLGNCQVRISKNSGTDY